MSFKSILIRFGKLSCILLISYVSLGIGYIIKDSGNLADELDKLSDEFENNTGPFHSSVMEFGDICYRLNIYLVETRVPDRLKERAHSKIEQFNDALEREDYDFVKSELIILKKIELMVELAVEFADVDKKKRDDYFFGQSELIMLKEIDSMVLSAFRIWRS